MIRAAAVVIATIICRPAFVAAGDDTAAPPANLVSGAGSHDAAKLDPLFGKFKVERMSTKFSEEKHVALLAKPLVSTGTIYFDHDKGIARVQATPKPQLVVLTKTTLRITKGDKVEEIPLDKSKDLRAFALIFPTLLRGERAELDKTFDIALYGSDADWWAVTFAPKTDSLKKLVKRVVVFGHKADVVSLQIAEASGDTTDTKLTQISRNGDVKDAEIATAFGAK